MTAFAGSSLDYSALPSCVDGGIWPTPHLQGVTLDDTGQYMYFSFTTQLVKTDLQGRVVGSVVGLTGHLGDLCYADGWVYGSLEYKSKDSFYIAAFDCEKITAPNMPHNQGGVMDTLFLQEVHDDYVNPLDAGEYHNRPSSMGHKFGCSGIDGITIGPVPGSGPSCSSNASSANNANNEKKLMVAYGIYSHLQREDNNYQIILQYNLQDLKDPRYRAVLDQTHYHATGPTNEAKYFVYTGNTTYGVQNLAWDSDTGDYWMTVYRGEKPTYPNYLLYGIDGHAAPRKEILSLGNRAPLYADSEGQPATGQVLQLKSDEGALYHAPSKVYGWNDTGGNAATGFLPLGQDYFYISESGPSDTGSSDSHKEMQYGLVHLYQRNRSSGTFQRV